MNKEKLTRKAQEIISILLETDEITLDQLYTLLNDRSIDISFALGSLIDKEEVFVYKNGDEIIVKSNYSYPNLYY